jgi:hypothetical protein
VAQPHPAAYQQNIQPSGQCNVQRALPYTWSLPLANTHSATVMPPEGLPFLASQPAI